MQLRGLKDVLDGSYSRYAHSTVLKLFKDIRAMLTLSFSCTHELIQIHLQASQAAFATINILPQLPKVP